MIIARGINLHFGNFKIFCSHYAFKKPLNIMSVNFSLHLALKKQKKSIKRKLLILSFIRHKNCASFVLRYEF